MKNFVEVTQKHTGNKVLLALSIIKRVEQITWDGANNARVYYTDENYSGKLGDVEVQETFVEVSRRIGEAQETDYSDAPIG